MTNNPDKNYGPKEFAVHSTLSNPAVEAEIMELENYLRANGDLDDYEINAACRLKRDLLLCTDEARKLDLESQLFDLIHGEPEDTKIKVLKTLDEHDGRMDA
ncbi:hypothetical protein HY463_01205 [Candidatus Peregrinibacteria bacterium]|nr:hypothetical protein [Candidatus Peregrinibacteria bacterium]